MIRRGIFALILALSIPFAVSGKEQGRPLSVDAIQVLKIDGQDGRAVIKTSDGKKTIIKAGDAIGDNAKVTEIVSDRVVIEEKKGQAAEKVVIRIENGKQRVERIRKTDDSPRPTSARTAEDHPARKPVIEEHQSGQPAAEAQAKQQKKKAKKVQTKKVTEQR